MWARAIRKGRRWCGCPRSFSAVESEDWPFAIALATRVAREVQRDDRWRSSTAEQLRRTDPSVGITQFVRDVEAAPGKLFPLS